MNDPVAFLLGDAARLLRKRFDMQARGLGVTRPQWQVLFALARNEGARQRELADYLDLEAISLSRMIDRMTDSGLVERQPDPHDRRAWRLFLTPKGTALRDELATIGRRVEAEALAGIDEAAADNLRQALTRIRCNLTPGTAHHGTPA